MKFISLKNLCLLAGIAALMMVVVSCESDEPEVALTSIYSGIGNLTFAGDTAIAFVGKEERLQITTDSGFEIFPLSLTNNDDLTLIVSIASRDKLSARTYTVTETDSEASATIRIGANFYTSRSGTMTITTFSNQEINGTVDIGLNNLFSSNDDLTIKGTFELSAQ